MFEDKEATEATCILPAYSDCTQCKICDEYLVAPEETSPALGHNYVSGICERCGNICIHADMDIHYCNDCGLTLDCYDNEDHKCDYCEEVISECKDNDYNHKCDICNEVLSGCTDANKDHNVKNTNDSNI